MSLRIIQIIQRPQLRGAETFASQISAIHKKSGHEVVLVSLFPAPDSKKLFTDGVELIELRANEKSRIIDWEGWNRLGNFIKAFKPNVVQANAGDTLKYAVFSRLAAKWDAPLVYRNANKASDFINSLIQKSYNKWLVNQADYIASVSSNCADDFIKTYRYPTNRVGFFPIGTKIISDTLLKGRGLREEISVSNKTPLIINIGSFVQEKNHIGLLQIFNIIFKSRQDVHLVLVGDGKLRPQIESRIKKLGLQKNVHLLGYRNDALEILDQSNIMLMPSTIEGLPGVILEAMAHRIPVVASNVGGIPEVIKHNETGFIFNPNEHNAFAIKTLELLQSENNSALITEKAYNSCYLNFDIEKVAEKFIQLYFKLNMEKLK